MPELEAVLPARRPELLLTAPDAGGQHVVKNRRTGEYYQVGEETHFLLARLDGKQTAESACAAFEVRFGEPLSVDDLHGFLEAAQAQDFLQPPAAPGMAGGEERLTPAAPRGETASLPRPPGPVTPEPTRTGPRYRQSLLHWRLNLFDPDQLFSWLEPKLRFFWTRTFFALSAACILVTVPLVWANRQELVACFPHALHWQTVVLAWLTLVVATTLHEFAHGLTCKHHGGEVHEVGFLMIYLLPCFYCNVSDAWLFREKSKRLWVTLAGGYCDLCLWALAMLIWRLTLPQSLLNYVPWVALCVCGGRLLFNLNPLLKMDGYYLLSDLLEIPNLQPRAWDYLKGHLRWLLWGAPRPAPQPRGKLLLAYGIASWLFLLALLSLTFVVLVRFVGTHWGLVGGGAAALLGVVVLRRQFTGFGKGELLNMFRKRPKRTAGWALATAALAALFLVHIEDRAGGTFRLRAATRAELHAQVAGFLQEVYFDEGDRVARGAVIARLEVPDLDSRTAQKQAEVHEAQAKLDSSRAVYDRARQLVVSRSVAQEQLHEAQMNYLVNQACLARLQEEARYLKGLREKVVVTAPVAGLITTPRLREKVGQYFKEGDLICEVEEPGVLEAEIAVPEQELAAVEPGQSVELKVRALPFETIHGTVSRLAPGVERAETRNAGVDRVPASGALGEAPSTLIVYCRLEDHGPSLRPGMSGYARIYHSRRPVGAILAERALRYLRTEFWW